MPRLAQAALPDMLERGAGKILLIGSAFALRGRRLNAPTRLSVEGLIGHHGSTPLDLPGGADTEEQI